MFCYQCEQTANCQGCTKIGVCGKEPETSDLQDLLLYVLKILSKISIKARANNIDTHKVDVFICKSLFDTLTNVNFDEDRIIAAINQFAIYRDELASQIHSVTQTTCPPNCLGKFQIADNKEDLLAQAKTHSILDKQETNPDILSLKNTVIFTLKGIAAYADHAQILGTEDPSIYHFIKETLAKTLQYDLSLENWIDMLMQCGQTNLKTMGALDKAHNESYGHPTPTQVPLGAKAGKAILISGHDLKDLEILLKQTEGKDINIYTHGEMLPAHGYPGLKKYKHFYGHYGTAWQNQHKEFAAFPGTILMTTNCLQKPLPSYHDNIFTTGEVGFHGVTHLTEKDFTPLINKALKLTGFTEDTDKGTVTVGFAHHTVLSLADKIIDAVKQGKIRHFFLVGGCDGAKPGRNYYTEFVEQVPADCIVLTLACGKFRFFDKDLGDIDGIPRLLDIGQCNDAYSAIQIALALAQAFDVSVNELPLTLVLSWYEQKAVAILITLLSLGIKNIRLGPTLPAFVSPNVLNYLVENFNIQLIGDPKTDLAGMLK